MTNKKAIQQHKKFVELTAKLYNYSFDSSKVDCFNEMMKECETNEEREDVLCDMQSEVNFYMTQEEEENSFIEAREELEDLRLSYFGSLL